MHSLNGGETIQRLSRQFDITPTAKTPLLPSFTRRRLPIQRGQISSIDVSYAASPVGNTGGLYLFLP